VSGSQQPVQGFEGLGRHPDAVGVQFMAPVANSTPAAGCLQMSAAHCRVFDHPGLGILKFFQAADPTAIAQ